ncbi:MAG: fold metallo-hydrolase, partial [Acidobacteria bacterium]|nr:fold metallo-hydrolase [Acidobacteriota bacterium]
VRVGLDDVRGYLMGGIETWVRAGYPLAQTPQVSVSALAALLDRGDTLRILDVRDPAEWREGHIRGAIRVRCGELSKRLDEIPRDGGPIAIVCAAGYRSTVAASVLERAGFSSVINVTGGMNAWKQAGLPLAIS